MLDNNCKEHEIAGTVIGHQEPGRIPVSVSVSVAQNRMMNMWEVWADRGEQQSVK